MTAAPFTHEISFFALLYAFMGNQREKPFRKAQVIHPRGKKGETMEKLAQEMRQNPMPAEELILRPSICEQLDPWSTRLEEQGTRHMEKGTRLHCRQGVCPLDNII